MGMYTEHILPRCIDLAMSRPMFEAARARATRDLLGDVLEVGFGSGLNLPHYPHTVTKVYAVDPSLTGRRLAKERLAACPIRVEWAGLDGQRIELPDASVDTVLSTFTLCTIPDLSTALRELLRVLKPGGKLHFVEHGRSPDARVARLQNWLDPIRRPFVGGCHLNRPIADAIRDAGFCLDRLHNYYLPVPKVSGYIYEGRACRCAKR